VSVLDYQQVAAGLPFNVPTRGNADSYTTYTIFTVPAATPSRIESVYIEPLFPDTTQHTELWELTFIDTAGLPIWRQATPMFGSSNSFTSEHITWARGMTGTLDDAPVQVFIPPDTNGCALATLPLPDLVLPAGATLEIGLFEITDGGLPSITVTNIAVTYTPDSSGTAITTMGDLLPLLAPIPLDEQMG
jgi:hypothetical protein